MWNYYVEVVGLEMNSTFCSFTSPSISPLIILSQIPHKCASVCDGKHICRWNGHFRQRQQWKDSFNVYSRRRLSSIKINQRWATLPVLSLACSTLYWMCIYTWNSEICSSYHLAKWPDLLVVNAAFDPPTSGWALNLHAAGFFFSWQILLERGWTNTAH